MSVNKYITIAPSATATGWVHLTLNRPEVKNAFHPSMIAEITAYFKNLPTDVKGVFLSGSGTAFCAGADLNWMKEMVQYTKQQNLEDSAKLWDMFDSIMQSPVPVVGLVHGAVFGGALGLVAACDYVVAEANTKFCFSEVKLGLAPAVISSFVLRKVSDGWARPYMISADIFDETTANKMGLVHQLAEKIDAPTIEAIQKKFKSNSAQAMSETKKLLNDLAGSLNWSEQKNRTTSLIADLRVSEEAQKRLKTFLEGSKK